MSTDSGSCGSLDRAQARMAMFEYQPPAVLNRPGATVVANTWYEILPATENCYLYMVNVAIEDTGETLEWRLTMDGEQTAAQPLACGANTNYYGYIIGSALINNEIALLGAAISLPLGIYSPIEGRSITVEVRKTTANGVGNLRGIVLHGVLSRV